MNRLTEPNHKYHDLEFMDIGMAGYMNQLSKYEDTGLTPEEINILADFRTKNKGVEEYLTMCVAKNEAVIERNHYRCEAKKAAAKLGKIKTIVEDTE